MAQPGSIHLLGTHHSGWTNRAANVIMQRLLPHKTAITLMGRVMRGHCQALNRPYEDIQKTTLFMAPIAHNGHLDPAALDYITALAALGVDEVMVRYPADPATFDLLAAELIPMVEKIPVAGR